MSKLSARVNLQLDMPLSIQIDKEAEKRGITRAQFIKESIHEKINRNTSFNEDALKNLTDELKQIKLLTMSIFESTQKKGN